MDDSIQAILSNASGLTEQYRTITQNLANSNTAGYKRRVNAFSQTLMKEVAKDAQAVQAGKVAIKSHVDFRQGSMRSTGQPMDMAIVGNGMFVLETPEGPLYTRNGTFRLNNQGQVVDHLGRMVSGQDGPIVVPGGTSYMSVKVSSEGEVFAAGRSVGKIKLVEFQNPDQLKEVGENYFRAVNNYEPEAAKNSQIQQGFQENSNVNVVEELVGLITVSRMYEASMKTVQTQDERMRNLLGSATR